MVALPPTTAPPLLLCMCLGSSCTAARKQRLACECCATMLCSAYVPCASHTPALLPTSCQRVCSTQAAARGQCRTRAVQAPARAPTAAATAAAAAPRREAPSPTLPLLQVSSPAPRLVIPRRMSVMRCDGRMRACHWKWQDCMLTCLPERLARLRTGWQHVRHVLCDSNYFVGTCSLCFFANCAQPCRCGIGHRRPSEPTGRAGH